MQADAGHFQAGQRQALDQLGDGQGQGDVIREPFRGIFIVGSQLELLAFSTRLL